MRCALLTILALVLSAGPASALPLPESYLRIDNHCDDALRVEVRGQSPDATRERVTLEPNSALLIPVEAIPDNPVRLEVKASLGKSRATETCTVYSGETTVAGVYCEPAGRRRVNLSIVCETPTLAALVRDAGVLTASTGGLAVVLLFSSLLGRVRRRTDTVAGHDPAGSGDESTAPRL